MRKHPHMAMTGHDLGELYTYLGLFMETYTDCQEACAALQACIEEIYMTQFPCADAKSAMLHLKNPRGAGRKKHYTGEMKEQIHELAMQGRSIREISRLTGIPKSTIQRLKSQ